MYIYIHSHARKRAYCLRVFLINQEQNTVRYLTLIFRGENDDNQIKYIIYV